MVTPSPLAGEAVRPTNARKVLLLPLNNIDTLGHSLQYAPHIKTAHGPHLFPSKASMWVNQRSACGYSFELGAFSKAE